MPDIASLARPAPARPAIPRAAVARLLRLPLRFAFALGRAISAFGRAVAMAYVDPFAGPPAPRPADRR